MLIQSHRHRQADLNLWAEFEKADMIREPNMSKIAKSIRAVNEFLRLGPAYVGVSWGKDSVVASYLTRQVNAKVPLINLRCNNRNPDCDAVRDAYIARFPDTDYREVVIDYGRLHADNLSVDELDAATDKVWHEAIRVSGRPFCDRRILGIRSDESSTRRIRCLRWGENSQKACALIAWWNTDDVFGFLARNNLPTHPAYAMLGSGRWQRESIRVAEIGDTRGRLVGRGQWEREYYGDILNRLRARKA